MTGDRWRGFDKRFQLLAIGSEFERARVAEERGLQEDVRMMLDRALELIDLSLGDPKWRDDAPMLLGLRDEVVGFRNGERTGSVAVLFQAL
ncbi:MAG TPA: hypothetical protein VJ521_01025 [Acidobacteriota bacterium]|uniref:Uncharacterized protein n=1 Tax=Candidatus Liptonbacteria bacterium RIFCSPLOWO2_01_FULL_56_20 TaxID=1798652 RepID=A0A1G2CHZ8_9BACT|nr:MAG: hypothetical protein A2681_00190 [Candidatus Liptonbacteria bacterium RIFCSPHIGHO2_01_FULL_56_18b]OGZ01023.1 MAG: hypothetical protein A3A43_03060 [Candidatus Liptonbacteria bacterium RIFCSPLOWO2_01_FULL_56_20]HJZ10700.1 hypothetical protein [Acidobacteriota bacterium]